MAESTKLQTYKANCHCGDVRLTVQMPDLLTAEVIRCNCSICTKNGYLLAYPKREDVVFTAGEDKVAQYRFGAKLKPHKFCPKCGTSILIDFHESKFEKERPYLALNIRTIENIEDLLPKINLIDGDEKNKLQPPYRIPE